MILILAAWIAPTASAGPSSAPAREDPLPQILEKTRDYCRRLGASSLYFVCREKIDERQYSPPLVILSNASAPQAKLTRVLLEYDYQLVRKGESVEEQRVLLKENKQPRNEPGAELKTRLYKHKNLVFGPGAFFSEYWQPRHAYTCVGEDLVGKDDTFVIEAAPAGAPEPDLVYGKAWVRKKDFAIVKIEWDQRCLGNYDQVLAVANRIGHQAEPRLAIACTYGIDKNGIRFPDKMTIREEYWSTRGTYRISETTVRYEDYRFFIVETEVKY
ncbi:MAG TPA: hypothetical protein VLJ16_15405 [Acidobacteriota bacterium]|nr:hypothetical protein [Acidobacteriota bacterium]